MKVIFGLFLIFASTVITHAQPANSSWLTQAERAKFEQLRVAGSVALYDLDYESARKIFKEMAVAFPNYPAGPQFLADTLLIEALYQTRRLQASLYNSDSFYSQNEDKADPKLVDQFRTYTRQARQLTEARLKQNRNDTEALYFFGAIEGLKASFEETVERRHFAALKDGNDAVDSHRDVIKLDPNYRDAEMTIGLYDYTIGALPLPTKIAVGMLGHRGSRKRGIATIERVAREGNWVKEDAKTLLILLYSREKRFAEAATIAREMGAKYQRNYLYKLEMADALVAQAAQEREANHVSATSMAETEAFATFESLLHYKNLPETTRKALDLIHFKYGEALMTAGLFDRAGKEFVASAQVPGAQEGLATMAHLYAARALDLSGKRNDALTQYRAVLARPNVYDAHEQAQSGLREAYKKKLT
ncbi:MAG TPA: hypothetical protein VGQ72_13355 [Pyrinomonadaceae bacterium]|jgi:hypothetical protein|nr:hypothetical protein [Pyrinomonadaceae bacterium]